MHALTWFDSFLVRLPLSLASVFAQESFPGDGKRKCTHLDTSLSSSQSRDSSAQRSPRSSISGWLGPTPCCTNAPSRTASAGTSPQATANEQPISAQSIKQRVIHLGMPEESNESKALRVITILCGKRSLSSDKSFSGSIAVDEFASS